MENVDQSEQRKISEGEWWNDWWKRDWSWDGLKEKGWIGGEGHINGGHTIQDYWRIGPDGKTDSDGKPVWTAPRTDSEMEASGELVRAPDGRLWHIAHIPLNWNTKDGLPSPKADETHPVHKRLNLLIGERLAASRETQFRSLPEPIGQEGRAILYGLVWPQPLLLEMFRGTDVEAYDDAGEKAVETSRSIATLHAKFSLSWLGALHAMHCNFGPGVDFYDAYFAGIADFTATVFAGRADFNRTRFAEGAHFNYAKFSSQASFEGAHFIRDVDFHKTRFVGLAMFSGTQFEQGADFQEAVFRGAAVFGGARFSGQSFSGGCAANFERSAFSKRALFSKARFVGDTKFKKAKFDGMAVFLNVNFSEGAAFESTRFIEVAQFDGSTFLGDVSFSSACFSRDTYFEDVTFEKSADFGRSLFLEGGSFSGATFNGCMRFLTARFSGFATFSSATLPIREVDSRQAFRGALFEFAVDLQGVKQMSVSALSGVTLNRGVLMSRNSELHDNELHANALQLALGARERDDALRALEGGAQKLKLAMERDSDKLREQGFYRLELRARRKQSGTPWTEKLFSGLYAVTANYGASIGRPTLLLLVMMCVLAAGFYGLDFLIHPREMACDPIGAVWQALDFSWSNVFKPFMSVSAQSNLSSENPLAFRLLHDESGNAYMTGFIVRAVSTLQSILALVLAFLVALTIRRRFQIS
jgi:uncharacterized protein YjbI with pentapeptide repeats